MPRSAGVTYGPLVLALLQVPLGPEAAWADSGRGKVAEPPAPTDEAGVRARARYDAGTQAFAQGRFVEAALQFEAAASEKPSPIALYTAALSWEHANTPERAADDYTRALAVGGLAPESSGQASLRLTALEGVLGMANVSAPPGWRAQLDGGTEVGLPAVFHGAAGVHTLEVRPPGLPLARVPVVLKSGTTTAVALPQADPAAPAATQAPPAEHGLDLRTSIGLVAFGGAGVALLGGLLLGSEALSARDAYDGARTNATFDHASNLEHWTDVAWVTTGVLAATGLVLVLWPSSRGGQAPAQGHAPLSGTPVDARAMVAPVVAGLGGCGRGAPGLCIRGGF
jgi:hypothetical protein